MERRGSDARPSGGTMDRCKDCSVSSIHVNYQVLESPGTDHASKPVVQIHWQTGDDLHTRGLLVTIYKKEHDEDGSVHQHLLRGIVKDSLSLYMFSRDMFQVFNLMLTSVRYPPLEFVFFQTKTCSNMKNVAKNKKKFVNFLRKFVLRGENSTEDRDYEVNVRTGNTEEFRSQSDQIVEMKTSDNRIYGQVNIRIPPEIEGMFLELEQELTKQGQYIDTQLKEQQRQNDYIDTQLTMITKRLRSVEDPLQLQSTETRCSSKGDGNQETYMNTRSVSKCSQDQAMQVSSLKAELSKNGKGEDMPVEPPSSQKEESSITWNPPTLKAKDKRGILKTITKDNALSQALNMKCLKTADLESQKKNNSPNQPPLPADATSCDGEDLSKQDMQVGTEPENPPEVNGTSCDDDIYSDYQNMASGYQSSNSRRLHKGTYQSGYKGKHNPSLGTDHDTLVEPSDSTTYKYTPQNYNNCEHYSGTDSESCPRSLYPSVQSNEPNFVVRRNNFGFSENIRSDDCTGKEKVWDGPKGRQKLRMIIECMVSRSPNREHLYQTFEKALENDATGPPRVDKAMDTVICLDNSDIMTGSPFDEMKWHVLRFIDGLESVSTKYDIEENIALVTLSGSAKVVHYLSNDYGSVREALDKVDCGGTCQMLEGLVVAMACLSKGGLYKVDDNFKLPPRLIVLSNGYPSEELQSMCRDVAILPYAFAELAPKQMDDGIPLHFILLSIGARVSTGWMTSFVEYCGGVVTNPEAFVDMAKYQRLQLVGVNALRGFRDSGVVVTQPYFFKFLSQFTADINRTDAQQVYDMVSYNMGKVMICYGDSHSFYNICEYPGLPPLGSRVIRGSDWRFGNQDTEGPGTILNHFPGSPQMVCVYWDNEHVNVYRFGHEGMYDIAVVPDQPRFSEEYSLDIGVQVERGPDWHSTYKDQDGGRGQWGTIIRNNHNGQVMVRWQNGNTFVYRSFFHNDVVIRYPVASVKHSTAQNTEANSSMNTVPMESDDVDGFYIWQREDQEKGWESYTESETRKLHKEFSRNREGSCLILRHGKSFRVSFRSMQERSIENSASVAVRRSFQAHT